MHIERYFNLAGDTSIFTSRGSGSAFNFAAVLMRHGLGLHAGTNPAFPDAVIDGEVRLEEGGPHQRQSVA